MANERNNNKKSPTSFASTSWEDALLRLGVFDRKARSKMTNPEHRWRILRYQRVLDTAHFQYPPSSSTFVSVKAFVQHIHYLKHKCNVIPLTELHRRIETQEEIDPFTIALTFDGGYSEHVTDVAPLLEHLHLPATFFLMPRYLDTPLPRWPEAIMAFATFCKVNGTSLSSIPEFDRALNDAGRISGFSNWNHFEQAEQIISRIVSLPLEARESAVATLMGPISRALTSHLSPTFASKAGFKELNQELFTLAITGMTGESMTSLSKEDQVSEVLSAQERLKGSGLTVLPYFAFPNGLVVPEMLVNLSRLKITAAFGLDISSRKPITRKHSVPLFPRLSIYQDSAPHQVAFIKKVWELAND